MGETLLKLADITKEFPMGKTTLTVLKGVEMEVRRGEFIAIMGASGSGKSTMLNIIGCLDKPSKGTYYFGDQLINELDDDELSMIRNQKFGFVFQSFNLLPYYTALKNVEVPLSYQNKKDRNVIAKELLERVGLGHRIEHKPAEMSGGEKQRIAIARALSTNPEIILADEPTGALDSTSGTQIMEIFANLNKEGKTIIMVTHDNNIAAYAQRIVRFKDGRIEHGNS